MKDNIGQAADGRVVRSDPAAGHPTVRRRALTVVRRALQPAVITPAVLGFGLLGFVVLLGRPDRTGALITRVGPGTILLVFGLTVPYLAARAVVWRQLLQQGGARLVWRPLLMAFAGGEFAKSLPGGIYFENYLLRSSSAVPVGQSLAATIAVSGLEAVLAIPVVLTWSIPGWHWLRPTLSAVLLLYVVGLAAIWWVARPSGEKPRLSVPRSLAPAMIALRAGMAAARPFISLRTLRDNLLPTAVSLAVMAIDLLIVGRAIGVEQLDLHAALVVFCFTVLALILLPIPTDVGLTEASGAGALTAFGASPSQAVATFLVLRILLVGSTMLLTAGMMLVLWQRGLVSHLSTGG